MPCFSDANCGGRFASCRHRQAVINPHPRGAQAVGRVGLRPVGSFSEFLTCDVLPATPPKERRERLERSCLRRSLCLWHRRVALRAVGLKRGKEEGRVTAVKFRQALKYCDVRLLVWGAGALGCRLAANHCVGKYLGSYVPARVPEP